MFRCALPLFLSLAIPIAAVPGCQSVGNGGKRLETQLPDHWEFRLHEAQGPWVAMGIAQASQNPSGLLTIFIEGDGRAWRTRSTPSTDPTPRKPVALNLAVATDGRGNRAYVGRPCQFEARAWKGCNAMLWTQERYGAANLQAMSEAIDTVKNYPQQPLLLVGYSGGGTIAALLAADRSDVKGFITIASNLDINYWTDLHRVTRLDQSVDPLDHAERLAKIPQIHFAGSRDDNVPPAVIRSYLVQLDLPSDQFLVVEDGFDHQCCWARDWMRIYDEGLSRLKSQTGEEDFGAP